MLLNDRTLLRLHLEAVWNIQLPLITYTHVNVLASGYPPPWLLYVAQMADEYIYVWRSNVDASSRQALLKYMAQIYSGQPDKRGIEREVALKFVDQPAMTQAQAQQLAQPITDQSVVEEFQPGASHYFFERSRAPLFGTIRDGRLLSIAHSSRSTSEACELGIETHPEARRRGYALAATILWTQAVLQENLVPIYSALADNAASLALADAAGYRAFAHGTSITNLP
ncbi:MAG: GNAT family N-acetyltransferase [Ktedonobacteraceae bacterium]|nr:GNAT family N-acetyltransferase [Ktedonobacteraceae bacterium]